MPAKVLVDTDVFSFLWQGHAEGERFKPVVTGAIAAVSFTTLGEVWFGALHAGWGQPRQDRLRAALRPYAILPYARELSRRWGQVKATMMSRGRTIGDNDLWIAATALHYDIPLATNNRSDFADIPGVQLVP